MGNPKLLLLDEPSLGLAPMIKKDILEALKVINKRRKDLSILMVVFEIFLQLWPKIKVGYKLLNSLILLLVSIWTRITNQGYYEDTKFVQPF